MGRKVLRRISDGDIFPMFPGLVGRPGFEVVELSDVQKSAEAPAAPVKKRKRAPKRETKVITADTDASLDDLLAGIDSGN